MKAFKRTFFFFVLLASSWALSGAKNFITACASIGGEVKEGLCFCKKNGSSRKWHKEGKLRHPKLESCHRKTHREKKKRYKNAKEVYKKINKSLKKVGASKEFSDKVYKVLCHSSDVAYLNDILNILLQASKEGIPPEKQEYFLELLVLDIVRDVSGGEKTIAKAFRYKSLGILNPTAVAILNFSSNEMDHFSRKYSKRVEKILSWDFSNPQKNAIALEILKLAACDYDALFVLEDLYSRDVVYHLEDFEAFKVMKNDPQNSQKTLSLYKLLPGIAAEHLARTKRAEKFKKLYSKRKGLPSLSDEEVKSLVKTYFHNDKDLGPEIFSFLEEMAKRFYKEKEEMTFCDISEFCHYVSFLSSALPEDEERKVFFKYLLNKALSLNSNSREALSFFKGLPFYFEQMKRDFPQDFVRTFSEDFSQGLEKFFDSDQGIQFLIHQPKKFLESATKAAFLPASFLSFYFSARDSFTDKLNSFKDLASLPRGVVNERFELLFTKQEKTTAKLHPKVLSYLLKSVPLKFLNEDFLLRYLDFEKALPWKNYEVEMSRDKKADSMGSLGVAYYRVKDDTSHSGEIFIPHQKDEQMMKKALKDSERDLRKYLSEGKRALSVLKNLIKARLAVDVEELPSAFFKTSTHQ